MSDSMVYTIGTALNRAKDQDLPVEVLVEGQWLAGRVQANDGHGLVLTNDSREQSVVRMSSISAVRILNPSKASTQPVPGMRAQQQPARTYPMPGPRTGEAEQAQVVRAISSSNY